MSFEDLHAFGFYQYGNMFVYLNRYDLVGNNFGLVAAMGSTFEESVVVSLYQTTGGNVTPYVGIQHALLT